MFTSRQLLFKEVFVGTLIYTVVLGFLDDYTSVVEARSFSYVFFAAIVLEVLTVGAFAVKNAIVRHFRPQESRRAVALMAFGVWFVMFSSKFVFIWVIDFVFVNEVNINGFFGIFLVALLVTVVYRVAEWMFVRLGSASATEPATS